MGRGRESLYTSGSRWSITNTRPGTRWLSPRLSAFHTMSDFFDARRPHNGLTYTDYRAEWKNQKEMSVEGLDPDEKRLHHYLNYNWDRQALVHDEYNPSDALTNAVTSIDDPQLWMVLTEPWCGDSAFLLPVLAEAAGLNDDVTFRILLRDDNLDIMDEYLTGGSRGIPKLVAFSEDGTERFTWGPRPDGARTLFAELQENCDDKMNIIETLITHYEDGGWREADGELAEAIRTASSSSEQ